MVSDTAAADKFARPAASLPKPCLTCSCHST